MLAKTPVTQHSPCYSAVSALLMKPLPDLSNYSPLCHTHYLILWINTSLVLKCRPFTKPLRSSLLQHFTTEPSQELMPLEVYCSAMKELTNKQRQVVSPPLQIVISTPFCLFLFISILSLLLFSILSLPFPHFP